MLQKIHILLKKIDIILFLYEEMYVITLKKFPEYVLLSPKSLSGIIYSKKVLAQTHRSENVWTLLRELAHSFFKCSTWYSTEA